MKRIARGLMMFLISVTIVAMTAWGVLAIYYSNLPGTEIRKIVAYVFALFGAVMLGLYLLSKDRRRSIVVFAAVFVLLLLYWSMIQPRQDRDWAAEYARPAHATISGDLVTIHDIRNFDYRTETDFTPLYYVKTFYLKALDSVDAIASYWMGEAIAHIMLSFGSGQKDFVAVSIETRRERNPLAKGANS
jgi:hypothetical protein